ncbi:hypothetical protein ACI65C_007057, partial [Semiaphis heraclei]
DDDEINAAYLSEEYKSVEGCNRKPKRQRNLNSYLCPNPNLRHLQINNSKNIQSLPLLKNGSRAQELKSCTITNIGKVILKLVNNGISSKTYTKRAELMNCIDSRIALEKTNCGYINNKGEACQGVKTKTTMMSTFHIFVELLNWD